MTLTFPFDLWRAMFTDRRSYQPGHASSRQHIGIYELIILSGKYISTFACLQLIAFVYFGYFGNLLLFSELDAAQHEAAPVHSFQTALGESNKISVVLLSLRRLHKLMCFVKSKKFVDNLVHRYAT